MLSETKQETSAEEQRLLLLSLLWLEKMGFYKSTNFLQIVLLLSWFQIWFIWTSRSNICSSGSLHLEHIPAVSREDVLYFLELLLPLIYHHNLKKKHPVLCAMTCSLSGQYVCNLQHDLITETQPSEVFLVLLCFSLSAPGQTSCSQRYLFKLNPKASMTLFNL